MFKWLKNLFGKKDSAVDSGFPFPTAKGQDQSASAPYKVEPPAEKIEVAKKPSKKPAGVKKTPNKTTSPRRGRKPKAKPAE